MRLELVVLAPRLLERPDDALAACRPLASLAGYAGRPRRFRDMYGALFTALGMPQDTPIAPLALLGSGGDPGDDFVLCAQPAHLEAGPGHALVVDPVSDLAPAETDVLVRMLDRHFADDDLRFAAVRNDEWFARRVQASEVTMTSPDAARGQPLAQSLPRGADAARWKRWQDEIGMLLHDHALNEEREAAGRAAVNAVWMFGAGRLRDVRTAPPLSPSTLMRTLAGDLVRGLALGARPADELREAPLDAALAHARTLLDATATSSTFTVTMATKGEETMALEGALAHLERRDIDALHLIAAGRTGALAWTAQAPTPWRRLAARVVRHPVSLAPQDEA